MDSIPKNLDGKRGPLVSVILPVYDVERRFIEKAIESIAGQTYGEIELVIVDSSEEKWLQGLEDRANWILHEYQEPQGISKARNTGLSLANGDIVAFLDADDYYATEKIEKQVDVLQSGADIAYSDVYTFNEGGSTTRLTSLKCDDEGELYKKLFKSGHGVPNLTVASRSECFENKRFWEGLDAREDPHLWVRLFRKYEVARIPEPLAYKRLRSDSLTSDPDMMYENEKKSVEDLADRFEELREHKDERLRHTKYRYGKQLFHSNRLGEARGVFFSLITDGFLDYRVVAMFFLSLLPFGKEAAFQGLEKINEKAKRVF